MSQITYSNIRQEEFSALVRRLEETGLSPADVSRLLGVSKATVSKILAGKQTPRVPTLQSLRNIVEDLTEVKKVNPGETSLAMLRDQLSDLAKNDPAGYEAAKATIGVLHSRIPAPVARPPAPPKVSSIVDDAATKLLKLAAASVRRGDPE